MKKDENIKEKFYIGTIIIKGHFPGEKLIVSWNEYNQTVEKLAIQIYESGYEIGRASCRERV